MFLDRNPVLILEIEGYNEHNDAVLEDIRKQDSVHAFMMPLTIEKD